MLAHMLSLFNLTMAANNPINTLTTFAVTHSRGAASLLCPTCYRPLFKSLAATAQ